MNWPYSVYAFPPVPLVSKFLNKFLQSNISDALLIAPFWPSQPFFPVILNLLVDKPILFSVTLLVDSSQVPKPLSTLMALHISSRPERSLDYQSKLSEDFSGVSKLPLLHSTVPHGQDFVIGAIQNRLVTASCL